LSAAAQGSFAFSESALRVRPPTAAFEVVARYEDQGVSGGALGRRRNVCGVCAEAEGPATRRAFCVNEWPYD